MILSKYEFSTVRGPHVFTLLFDLSPLTFLHQWRVRGESGSNFLMGRLSFHDRGRRSGCLFYLLSLLRGVST